MPIDCNLLPSLRRRCRLQNLLWRNLLCEFAATAFLIHAGLSVDVQAVLGQSQHISQLARSIGWGLALVFAVQMAFPVTGAHLNPAVSFFVWSFGDLPFRHFLLYSCAQTLGAFVGAGMTFALYFDKITEFDGGTRMVSGPMGTAALFATYPGAHLSLLGSIIDQIGCTAMLCFMIGIITDTRNGIPRLAQPALMGGMLALLQLGYNMNAANAMNPARDFGPRLFTLLAGYGWEVFSYRNYSWFWVPLLCPFIGAFLGAWAYQLIISAQLPLREDQGEKFSSVTNGSVSDERKTLPKCSSIP